MRFLSSIVLLILASNLAALEPRSGYEVHPISEELGQQRKLDPFYTKHVSLDGFLILGSDKVSDYSLKEAAFLLDQMFAHRPEINRAMTRNKVLLAVMSYDERTTDVPEHKTLEPAKYWDRRARGLGATPFRPAVSCGEENLLEFPGDPYQAENILIHEFAHAMHEMGLNTIDPTFDDRLKKVFESAKKEGLWKDTYAMTNHKEYWAEGVQSYFNTNNKNNHNHGEIDTQAKLRKYDPKLAALCEEIYGKENWKYLRPSERTDANQTVHLKGYNPQSAPTFKWESELKPKE